MIKCAECGKELEDNFCYKFLDNFIQVKYFDSDKDNQFCSKYCACKSLMLEEVEVQEEEE